MRLLSVLLLSWLMPASQSLRIGGKVDDTTNGESYDVNTTVVENSAVSALEASQAASPKPLKLLATVLLGLSGGASAFRPGPPTAFAHVGVPQPNRWVAPPLSQPLRPNRVTPGGASFGQHKAQWHSRDASMNLAMHSGTTYGDMMGSGPLNGLRGGEDAYDSEMAYKNAYAIISDGRYHSSKWGTSTRLGSGQHGEVWKSEAVDGPSFAVKLVDVEEKPGWQIIKGEERGIEASLSLDWKAKTLAQRYANDPYRAAAFERALGRIAKSHYSGHDFNSIPEYAYIVMDYVEGDNLEKMAPSLTDYQKISIVAQLLEVIDLLSNKELGDEHAWVHRDIKPLNTMVKIHPDGSVDATVIDLGVITNGLEPNARNEYRGTDWPWVPPEAKISRGRFTTGPDGSVCAFDMYSLGALALEIFIGPEQVNGAEALNYRRRLSDFYATPFGQIVNTLMNGNPNERPKPAEVLEALAPFLYHP